MKSPILTLLLLRLIWPGPLFSKIILDYPTALEQNQPLHQPKSLPPLTYIYRTVPLVHANPKSITAVIQPLFPKSTIQFGSQTQTISFKCLTQQLPNIMAIIRSLDQPRAQINIDVKILELHDGTQSDQPPLFSTLKEGIDLTYEKSNNKITSAHIPQATFRHLLESNNATILSNPSVTTLENEPAAINIGEKVPYTTVLTNQFSQTEQIKHLDIGINLTINPRIVSKNHILVDLDMGISGIKLWQVFKSQKVPILSKQVLQTKVSIKPGHTLVLAGLHLAQEKKNHNKMQPFSDIPFIGDWFKGSETETKKTEILIVITPTILN
jgi:general secretion pathway protein D